MTEKTESGVSTLDTVKLVLAAALLVGGVFAYYWYSQESTLVRLGALVVALAAAIAVGMQSEPGRTLWQFMRASRTELRKVVWPTRVETRQTTIAVIVFVVIMGVFFWALDLFLLWVTRALTLTGQGS
jgi:preprotein translocase subunit SecE